MKRTLFLIICLLPALGPQALGAIEIYANGHKYDSLQAYLAYKKSMIERSLMAPAVLNSQQQDDIRKEAKQLGVDVDLSKVKTFQIGRGNPSVDVLHKLYVLSVENGMVSALQDFYQGWNQADLRMTRRISSQELQEAIQQEVTLSKAPKLLISEPGKVRIMALTSH